jgi:hypothetical protein
LPANSNAAIFQFRLSQYTASSSTGEPLSGVMGRYGTISVKSLLNEANMQIVANDTVNLVSAKVENRGLIEWDGQTIDFLKTPGSAVKAQIINKGTFDVQTTWSMRMDLEGGSGEFHNEQNAVHKNST